MTFPARRPSVRRWARASAVVLLCGARAGACSDERAASGEAPPTPPRGAPRPRAVEALRDPTRPPPRPPAADRRRHRRCPIYCVGDGPGGEPRLFREFHRVQGNPLTEAAALVMAGGQPDDPDYRTLWPEVEVADVRRHRRRPARADPRRRLHRAPRRHVRKRDAELAMQQLVYTLQGVQQERVPVVIKRGGTDFRLFGLPTECQHEQASALETLNLVNITSPEEGATVTGDTLTVTGRRQLVRGVRAVPDPASAATEVVARRATRRRAGWRTSSSRSRWSSPLDGHHRRGVVQCETDDPYRRRRGQRAGDRHQDDHRRVARQPGRGLARPTA